MLTSEGADEWLVGYPWYKIAKMFNAMDLIPGLRLSDLARRGYMRLNNVPQFPAESRKMWEDAVSGPNAWVDSYGMLALSKLRFYGEPMREVLAEARPKV